MTDDLDEGVADYVFVRALSRGTQGRFFLAEAPARLGLGGVTVAVKVLDRTVTDEEFRLVATELRVCHALMSPHLVDLYDAGYVNDRLFYAMAHYPDGSLAAPAEQLSAATIVGILAGAARGAHALHEVGLVHRDIKPANILIDGDAGRLSEPGLAQLMAPGLTSTGLGFHDVIEYTEPQVLWGDRGCRGTDIWALGVTLHHALGGGTMFQTAPHASVAEAIQHVLHQRPQVSPQVPSAVGPIIDRCVAEERVDRYPTAEALAADLDRVVARL